MSANGATPPPATVTVPQQAAQSSEAPKASQEIAVAPAPVVLADGGPVSPFAGSASFALAQQMATALSSSTVVPKEYQGNVGNCLIAIEMAGRIGMPAFMVMQNMVPIYGKPSWTSKFLIGIVNASPEWTPIRWRWVGDKSNGDDWGVRAVATDKRTGEECVGPLVDIAMAKAEGWYDRKSKEGGVASKWPTMPEVMLMYRSAAFWSRMFAPEKTLGLTTEEQEDIGGAIRAGSIDVTHTPSVTTPSPSKTLADVAARSQEQRSATPTVVVVPVQDPTEKPGAPAGDGSTPPAAASGKANLTDVAAQSKAKREEPKPVTPQKPEDAISKPAGQAPKGQATLPVGKPKPHGARVYMADGTPVDLDDPDASAHAAVAPTEKEIAANGPPPVSAREPGDDGDDLPTWAR